MSSSSSDGDTRLRHPSRFLSVSDEFAHPSEAIFAALLDLYRIEWLYEPVEFPLAWGDDGAPTKGFRPDFFLPKHRLFIELTVAEQRLVTRKNQKIRQFRELYPEATLLVVYQRDFRKILERHEIDEHGVAAA